MNGSDWAIVSAVAVLFGSSALLALAETAFLRMSRIRALALEDEGREGAARLARLLEHPEQTLNRVLLLVFISQFTAATLVGVFVERRLGAWGLVAGLVFEIVVFFVFAEVVPKTFAVQHAESVALRLSPLLAALTRFPPLSVVAQALISLANVVLPGKGLTKGPFVTEEEIRTMADVAAEEDVIESEERKLIHSIFEFGDMVVREAMVPRPDMVAVPAGVSVDDALTKASEAGYSRLPVFEESTDNIVGLVYLKDLVRELRAGNGQGALQPLGGLVRPAVFVPEQKRVAVLLRDMQEQKFHMAIVVDEYGATAGLVTLEDLLEEIVGEIVDEYDVEQPKVEHLDSGAVRVAGHTPIDEVNEVLSAELPATEWDTVGGLMLNLLGHVPDEGESVEFQGLDFLAERVQGRRIVSVHIRPLEPEGEPVEAQTG